MKRLGKWVRRVMISMVLTLGLLVVYSAIVGGVCGIIALLGMALDGLGNWLMVAASWIFSYLLVALVVGSVVLCVYIVHKERWRGH